MEAIRRLLCRTNINYFFITAICFSKKTERILEAPYHFPNPHDVARISVIRGKEDRGLEATGQLPCGTDIHYHPRSMVNKQRDR